MTQQDFALHRIGWKSFQDLCIAIVEERLQRIVQTFLATNDAGRDGAFLGTWDSIVDGESTIQCKFTSKQDHNLTLSMLQDELPKAKRLAEKGLATDYIILTNHPITGESELQIKEAFQNVGVGRCRVFHRDWIIQQIHNSPRLRMMVPRLYGLVDLSSLLDQRAYKQAQLILSELGSNLQKLVITEPHRKSVRAISEHNLVLLLGSPAAGKSTIGASLALGAADMWNCSTIKSTSPEHLQAHINPDGGQFFWIDDAWGSTQYQRDRTEAWNQVFPLIQGAMKKGSRFLITSRDYIWNSASKELKLQALPVLTKSQVIIDVHNLSIEEKGRILYNHLKLGDQNEKFRAGVKSFLPGITNLKDFLPESARRFGTNLFTISLPINETSVTDFFVRPKEFLKQTIQNLSLDCKAAIALVFMNGGIVRSPVPLDALEKPSVAFGSDPSKIRSQLLALNGSLLNLAEDEEGPYWTYSHPTVNDAFASYVAEDPELIEIYLRGAKSETLLQEVVCSDVSVWGATVVVPNSMHNLLLERIGNLPSTSLSRFISYRTNSKFSKVLLELRPDIWKRLDYFSSPLKDDSDVDLLTALYRQGLLPESIRLKFVNALQEYVIDEADASFLQYKEIGDVLTQEERTHILYEIEIKVLPQPEKFVDRLREEWKSDYDPNDYFDELNSSLGLMVEALQDNINSEVFLKKIKLEINTAISMIENDYLTPEPIAPPIQQSAAQTGSLEELFRDVDE